MVVSPGAIVFSLFLLVALVQVFYYLFFFSRLAYHKPKAEGHSQQHPVSVIICARDEEEALGENLPSVLAQEYPSTHEVIVVNDNSVDDSRYSLAELQKSHRQLQVVDLEQEAKGIVGKKFPLSIGIKESKHELVLLTDADCKPASPQWINGMQSAFGEGIEVALGYGGYEKAPGLLNKVIRFETFHTALQYFSYALAGVPYMGVGRNLAYRKALFFRNKGFSSINHIPSGDDDLFINQVANGRNTAVVLEPESFTYSQPKRTWKEWKRQKNRHYSTGKYYKASHKALLGLYTASFFFFYPFLLLSIVLFDWRLALIPFILRLVLQAIIWQKSMKRLGEEDLFPLFFLWDIWMLFYYVWFAPALWRKPRKTWN